MEPIDYQNLSNMEAGNGPSKEEDEMHHYLHTLRDQSLVTTLWREAENTEESVKADYIGQRLRAYMERFIVEDQLYEKLALLSKLELELRSTSGHARAVFDLFVKEVESMDGLTPLPTKEEFKMFFSDMNEMHTLKFASGKTLIDFSYEWYDAFDMESQNDEAKSVENKQSLRQQLEEAMIPDNGFLDGFLANVSSKYSHMPLLKWTIDMVWYSISYRKNVYIFNQSWNLRDEEGVLYWTYIGAFFKAAVVSGTMKDIDMVLRKNGEFSEGMTRVFHQRFPVFSLRMIELKGVLLAQVDRSQHSRGKVLAACMTLGIAAANLSMRTAYSELMAPHVENFLSQQS